MRKRKFLLASILCALTISVITKGFSAWNSGASTASVEEVESPTISNANVEPQAYIAGSTKVYYDTIPHALAAATSGSIVIAMPAVNNNYHSTNNPATNANIDKKVHTISENCEIKSGVTLVIPTDAAKIASVTNASTLNTYITSMKEDDHSRGSGYGSYATSNETRWLRVTVNVSPNVTITNNGTLVVSGYLNSGTSNGGLVGNTSHSYSKIVLDANAKIVQNNANAKTYCFGYINEKVLNNGSAANFLQGNLYIPFILDDYRGFSYSWALTYNSSEALSTYHSSAFNQFELRNIDSVVLIQQGVLVYGEITIYVSYPSQSVEEVFPKEISLVGTSSSSLCQLTDSTYSLINYKYNRTLNVAKIKFFGGMTLNYLTLSVSKSGVSVNLSTNNSYFPLSYRQSIEFSKADGQSSAAFNFSNQMIKVLPGSELIVNDGATLTGKSLIVYSAFYDGTLGNGYSSSNAYTSFKYPLKTGGVVLINSGGHLTCSTSIAGTIYGNSSDLTTPSTTSITSNEPWAIGSSGSLTPAWKITDYLQLNETLQLLPVADASKKKLCVGLNTFKNYNSYKPRVQIIGNYNESSQTTQNVYDSQKVLHYESLSNYKIEMINNVYKAYKESTYYTIDQVVSYNESAPYCCAINSTMSISSNNGGVNEFRAQSVTVTCTTPMIDGHIPLYPDSSVQCVANVVNIDKIYNKTITWSSSNESIATVTNAGVVTGVSLGNVRISATCDGVTGYIDLQVIEEVELENIEYITITDNKGNTSEEVKGSDGDATNYNGTYSDNTNVTFSVNVFPSSAPYASIKWTFTASAAGRQYVNDSTQRTEIIENVTSLVVHIVSGAGASADKATLKCDVTDLSGNVYTKTFVICHSSGCITENDFVLLADGSKVRPSSLKLGDMLKTWSFEKGCWVIEPIIFLEKIEDVYANVITLVFDDNSTIEISWRQGFFDADILDYFVVNDENFSESVGRNVLAFNGNEPIKKTIVAAYSQGMYTSTYEIHTGHGYQFVANDILTIEPLINEHVWFTVNENYKYDEELMRQDLETYGVLPYEVFADYVTEEQYDLFNGKYLSVPIGKGYFTLEELMDIIRHFLPGNT